MSVSSIRVYGDPVLNSQAAEVTDIDQKVVSLVESMIETMYAAPGVGLAANQVGIQKRIFVYDIGDGPLTVINPSIVESDGEWTYEEGCLSVPGLSWEITRPNQIHLVGLDLDGNEISVETDEFEGRVFQHEMDHLEGKVFVEYLSQLKQTRIKKKLAKHARITI